MERESLPKSMTEIVEEKIKAMIIADELALGESINETRLAQHFCISKTPVREALIRLSLQGSLITLKPRSGAFVFSPTYKDIDDISAVRVLLEQGALRLAMTRNCAGLLASLEKVVLAQDKLKVKPDLALYRSLDYDFHNTFFSHADNPCLDQAYQQISTKIYAMRCRLNFSTEVMAASNADHLRVYHLLRNGEINEACALLAAHVASCFTDRARRLLEDLVEPESAPLRPAATGLAADKRPMRI